MTRHSEAKILLKELGYEGTLSHTILRCANKMVNLIDRSLLKISTSNGKIRITVDSPQYPVMETLCKAIAQVIKSSRSHSLQTELDYVIHMILISLTEDD